MRTAILIIKSCIITVFLSLVLSAIGFVLLIFLTYIIPLPKSFEDAGFGVLAIFIPLYLLVSGIASIVIGLKQKDKLTKKVSSEKAGLLIPVISLATCVVLTPLSTLGGLVLIELQGVLVSKVYCQIKPAECGGMYTSTAYEMWKEYVSNGNVYSFKYPAKMFIWQDKPNVISDKEGSQLWANKVKEINGKSLLGIEDLGSDYLFLHTAHYWVGVNTKEYETFLNIKPGDYPFFSTHRAKVSDLPEVYGNNRKGYTTLEKIPEGNSFGYEAVWFDGSYVTKISVSSYFEETLYKNKQVFDRIVGSLKFLN